MGERVFFHGSTAPAFPAFSLEMAGRQPGKYWPISQRTL